MTEIKLSRGMIALVDDNDHEQLLEYNWTYDPSINYAYRRESVDGIYKKIYMHRQIMDFPINKQVDHINGDGLDNRKVNLRICSISENQHNRAANKNNTSGYKNIFKTKYGWQVMIMSNWKRYRKSFKKIDDAISYRNVLIKKLHGKFSRVEG